MKFIFIEDGEETEIEVDDSLCSISHIDLELEDKEEDEDKTEERQKTE